MAVVEGLGNCPLCSMKIEVGTPAKYYAGGGHGNVMAHTNCIISHEAHINTVEYKREQAKARVEQAQALLSSAKARLASAKKELEAFDDV